MRTLILAPHEARQAGGYPIERHFDLSQLDMLRERMVEVGAPESDLARIMIEAGYDYAIGAVALDLEDGGHGAASVATAAMALAESPEDCRVFPRRPLPIALLQQARRGAMPARLRGWIAAGAWVCGEPAEGDGFAVLPLLLPLARMRGRDARKFLNRAA